MKAADLSETDRKRFGTSIYVIEKYGDVHDGKVQKEIGEEVGIRIMPDCHFQRI